MAILVTGGAGYIGSVTAERLRETREEIVILDDLFRGHRAAVDSRLPFYQGRVGDPALLERITREHKIDSCVHFAALAYVGESVEKPAEYFENNVAQGVTFLRALLDAGVRHFVFSSTCATYGEPQEMPLRELTPQWPANPYGWSKLFMERILDSYDRAYGLKFVALRYFNASGATAKHGEHHEPESHLVPNVLAACTGKKTELSVFGNDYPTPDGTAIRDYIHVEDLASAHVRALDYLAKGGGSAALNLATGRGYSVREIITAVAKAVGRDVPHRETSRRPGDPSTLVADPSLARSLLGWRAECSELDTIIGTALAWEMRQHNASHNRRN